MENLAAFELRLRAEEKSALTVEKYLRDAGAFLCWLGTETLDKRRVVEYKRLLSARYAGSSVNSMLSGVNRYLSFIGRADCCVKVLRRVRRSFAAEERELTRAEYERLLNAAAGKPWLRLLMQAICSTGIRVSEHRFLTVEAARRGVASVCCKGRQREVLLPRKLCRALVQYARERGIVTGSIFIARSGRPLDRSRIWAEMKKLCREAKVPAEKVFPHNLRHLFARTYYAREKDIVRLADLLGHASVDTTRIYTAESLGAQRRRLERMGLYIT